MGFKETMMGFAGKVSDTVDSAIKSGSDSYNKMTEKNRLKKELTQLTDEVDAMFASVGRQLYTDEPDNAKFAAVFGEITQKREDIERIKQELVVLEDKVPCPSCGEMIAKAAVVCPKCGIKVGGQQSAEPAPEPERVEAEEVRFCTNCGSVLDGQAKFCPICGTPVKE